VSCLFPCSKELSSIDLGKDLEWRSDYWYVYKLSLWSRVGREGRLGACAASSASSRAGCFDMSQILPEWGRGKPSASSLSPLSSFCQSHQLVSSW